MKSFGLSDIGKIREKNEDLFLLLPPFLAVVADGMGGHQGGAEASRLAIETIHDLVNPSQQPPEGQIESWLAKAVEEANHKIFSEGSQNKSLSGMGTTISLAYIFNQKAYWAHVGDSRIYVFRKNKLKQITKDHTLTSAKEGKRNHILTRALGVQNTIKIDTGVTPLFPKDRLLLCSDGLYNALKEEKIEDILNNFKQTNEELVRKMVEKANELDGSDNITVVLMQIES